MKVDQLAKPRIRYVQPNADIEYDESQRYPVLHGITGQQWRELVSTGQPIQLSNGILARIGNSTATSQAEADEAFNDLEPEKKARAMAAIKSGTVEYPIVLKDGNTLDLLSGNTRLTAIVKLGLAANALVIDTANIKKAP